MMNTQNDSQNSGRESHGLGFWIQALNIVPTLIQFLPIDTPGKRDCIMN